MILTRMERSMHEEVGDTYLRGAYEILVICTLCIRAELDFFCRDECGAYEWCQWLSIEFWANRLSHLCCGRHSARSEDADAHLSFQYSCTLFWANPDFKTLHVFMRMEQRMRFWPDFACYTANNQHHTRSQGQGSDIRDVRILIRVELIFKGPKGIVLVCFGRYLNYVTLSPWILTETNCSIYDLHLRSKIDTASFTAAANLQAVVEEWKQCKPLAELTSDWLALAGGSAGSLRSC